MFSDGAGPVLEGHRATVIIPTLVGPQAAGKPAR
jgi:hypothetical protein